MEENDLIWRFIDGDCDEAETQAVRKRLAEDPRFKQAFEERQQLDQVFGELELEQPSMRFTTKVMENLPTLYQQLPAQQLLGAGWVKAFWASLSFVLVSTIGIGFFSPDAVAGSSQSPRNGLWEEMIRFPETLSLSYHSAIILSAVGTSFLLLMWLDRQLARQREKT